MAKRLSEASCEPGRREYSNEKESLSTTDEKESLSTTG